MTDTLPVDHPSAAARAADAIHAGEVIILPTDTVYGVAADLHQERAIAQLYMLKKRPPEKAIPVLLADPDDISQVAEEFPLMARKLAAAFWPGPLTIVVPRRPNLPPILSTLPTIGVRVPAHSDARAVIRACGGALAVTSANLSGQPNPLTAQEAALLGEGVSLLLDGGTCPGGQPSTVVDISGGDLRIVRAGPIDESALHAALGA